VDRHNGSSRASRVEPTTRLLVVGRIGEQRYAWPAASVERVLAMAAVTRVADLPPGVAGLIDVHGDTLAVVDPRPRLGLPAQTARPEQHLLLLHATGRYLLWVDSIETIVSVEAAAFDAVQLDGGEASAPFVTRVDGQLVSVLSPAVFDPGHVIQARTGAQ
jgi:chemotaxis signal transduction protein